MQLNEIICCKVYASLLPSGVDRAGNVLCVNSGFRRWSEILATDNHITDNVPPKYTEKMNRRKSELNNSWKTGEGEIKKGGKTRE